MVGKTHRGVVKSGSRSHVRSEPRVQEAGFITCLLRFVRFTLTLNTVYFTRLYAPCVAREVECARYFTDRARAICITER